MNGFVVGTPVILNRRIVNGIVRDSSSRLRRKRAMTVGPSGPYNRYGCYVRRGRGRYASVHFFNDTVCFPRISNNFAHCGVIRASRYIPCPTGTSRGIVTFTRPLTITVRTTRRTNRLRNGQMFVSNIKPVNYLVIDTIGALKTTRVIYTSIDPHSLSLNGRVKTSILMGPRGSSVSR